MVVLVMAAIAFFFLSLGAVAFTLCALVPSLRRFALVTALWLAVWGPCIVAGMLVAGASAMVAIQAKDLFWQARQLPFSLDIVGFSYAVAVLIGTLLIASSAAWLHQKLIARMTFALFRLYAAAVSAGVGSVWGWSLLLWLNIQTVSAHNLLLWIPCMALLCIGFGYFGYRFARQLRGAAPERFTWITPAEYDGAGS